MALASARQRDHTRGMTCARAQGIGSDRRSVTRQFVRRDPGAHALHTTLPRIRPDGSSASIVVAESKSAAGYDSRRRLCHGADRIDRAKSPATRDAARRDLPRSRGGNRARPAYPSNALDPRRRLGSVVAHPGLARGEPRMSRGTDSPRPLPSTSWKSTSKLLDCACT